MRFGNPSNVSAELVGGTVQVENTPGGTLTVGGTVDIGAGASVTATVDGPVTITPEAGSTFEVVTSVVDVQNASGTFLVTGDLPSVVIDFVESGSGNANVTTTTPIPQGMNALVIEGPLANDGGQPIVVNVYGTTTNVRYGWQLTVGSWRPTVVPIDPASDSTYVIVGGGGWVSYIRAVAQAPVLTKPAWQQIAYFTQSYSGNTSVYILNPTSSGTTVPNGGLLKSIDWRVVNGATGYQVAHVQIGNPGATNNIDTIICEPSTNNVASRDFTVGGGDGIPFETLSFVGNSTSTAIAALAINAVYEAI